MQFVGGYAYTVDPLMITSKHHGTRGSLDIMCGYVKQSIGANRNVQPKSH